MTHCTVLKPEKFYTELIKICEKTQKKIDDDLDNNIINNNQYIDLFQDINQTKGGSLFSCKGISKGDIRTNLYYTLAGILVAGSFACFIGIQKSIFEENGEPIKCEGKFMNNQYYKRTTKIWEVPVRANPVHFAKCTLKINFQKNGFNIFGLMDDPDGAFYKQFMILIDYYKNWILGTVGPLGAVGATGSVSGFYLLLDRVVEFIYKICNDTAQSSTNSNRLLLSNDTAQRSINSNRLLLSNAPFHQSGEPIERVNTYANKNFESRKRQRKSEDAYPKSRKKQRKSSRQFLSKQFKKKVKRIVNNRTRTKNKINKTPNL